MLCFLLLSLNFELTSVCCAVSQALKGGYVEPGPGGDPIRNPSVLPTGKNIHALDPQSIPTQAALKSARVVVERYKTVLLHLGYAGHYTSTTLLCWPISPVFKSESALLSCFG